MVGDCLQRPEFSMEPVTSCASSLQRKFSNEALPRYCAVALACLSLGGSIVKELWPLPDSYFSDKKNFLNICFVKFSWGWTFWFLVLFIALTNYYSLNKSISAVLRRLSALLVGTAIWFICTRIFVSIENYTGSCYESSALVDVKAEYTDKRACVRGGGFWYGFDISGHSFLLPYCILMILEETVVVQHIRLEGEWQEKLTRALIVVLRLLACIWFWMFLCTAIYFHNIQQKVIGCALGILGWYATYRWWYLKPWSPGLPPTKAKQTKRK